MKNGITLKRIVQKRMTKLFVHFHGTSERYTFTTTLQTTSTKFNLFFLNFHDSFNFKLIYECQDCFFFENYFEQLATDFIFVGMTS